MTLIPATAAEREKRIRLSRELSKLDRVEERRLAEEGIDDASWPVCSIDDDRAP
jgi:hypothetical protein